MTEAFIQTMRQAAVESASPAGKFLISDPEDFHGRHFNTKNFAYQHAFGNHPLFSIESIRALAKRVPKLPGFVYWQNGAVAVNAKWTTNPGPRLSLDDTLAGIAENNSLVILKHVEQDPVVGPILQALLKEVSERMSDEVRADVTIGESLLFVNSPRRKTAYHLDLEATHLLQVSGTKKLYVYDCMDRTLATHKELEEHCAGDTSSAVYDPARQGEAACYDMTAGCGAHMPSFAPHWVQNGDDVSVSINVNFDMRSVHHRLRPIYGFNHRLRKLGLNPTPPGESPAKDGMKVALYGAVKWLHRTALARKPSYPVWTPSRR